MGSGFLPQLISDILTEVSMIYDCSTKLSKLEFYVQALEGEMNKVDAFKRELPFCMGLLQEAIEKLRKEMMKWKGKEIGRPPVMEEFIPLRRDGCDDGRDGRAKWSDDMTDRKNWMRSVQLWSTPVQYEKSNLDDTRNNQDSVLSLKSISQKFQEAKEDSGFPGCNLKNMGGAFVPFKKAGLTMVEHERDVPVPTLDGLSLSIPPVAQVESLDLNVKEIPGSMRPRPPHPNTQRKQRRCWSPDLHKRFVDALQILGGPQNATPKQIRELMKVEGLTNDEVKSHLQKYRLHIRKLPTSLAAGTIDYSWLTGGDLPEDLSKRMVGSSASPQDHLHGGGSAKGGSGTGGESMEEDEDVKSESHS